MIYFHVNSYLDVFDNSVTSLVLVILLITITFDKVFF